MGSAGTSNAVSRADHQHDSWDCVDRTSAFAPFTSGTVFTNTFNFPLILYAFDLSGSLVVTINGILQGTLDFATGTFVVPTGGTVMLTFAGGCSTPPRIVFLS